MSGCTYTESNSVRMMAPVGQFSMQPARVQCLQTSDIINHANGLSASLSMSAGFSTKLTWRHVDAPRSTVLSYDMPVKNSPSSGSWFHSLHATSQALHPMQSVVLVKKPTEVMSARPPAPRSPPPRGDPRVDGRR